MRTYVRPMREYGFRLTEHDPDHLWIVLASEHRTVELEEGVNFHAWARRQWPAPHWTIELDPWADARLALTIRRSSRSASLSR